MSQNYYFATRTEVREKNNVSSGSGRIPEGVYTGTPAGLNWAARPKIKQKGVHMMVIAKSIITTFDIILILVLFFFARTESTREGRIGFGCLLALMAANTWLLWVWHMQTMAFCIELGNQYGDGRITWEKLLQCLLPLLESSAGFMLADGCCSFSRSLQHAVPLMLGHWRRT